MRMNRRSLLLTLASASLAATAATRPVFAGSVSLRLGHVYRRDDPLHLAFEDAAIRFAEAIQWRQDPFEVYAQGEVGYRIDLISALEQGLVDIIAVPAAMLAEVLPVFEGLGLPFLFRDAAHLQQFLANDGLARLNHMIADTQMQILAAGWIGSRHIFVKDPKTIDLSGAKLRVSEDSEMAQLGYRAMGFSPVSLSSKEVFPALSTGAVDGVEAPPRLFGQGEILDTSGAFSATTIGSYVCWIVARTAFAQNFADDDFATLMRTLDTTMQAHAEVTAASEHAVLEKFKNPDLGAAKSDTEKSEPSKATKLAKLKSVRRQRSVFLKDVNDAEARRQRALDAVIDAVDADTAETIALIRASE